MHLDPAVSVAYFLLIGGLSLVAFSYGKYGKSLVRCRKSGDLGLLLAASIAYPIFFYCFVRSMLANTITETVITVRFGPAVLLILSIIFLKETVKRRSFVIFGLLFCLAGIIFQWVYRDGKGDGWSFIYLGVIAIAAYATFRFCLKLLDIRGFESPFVTGQAMTFGGIGLVTFLVFQKPNFLVLPSGSQFLLIFFLGVFTVGIPTVLQIYTSKMVASLSKISLVDYTIPIFTITLAFIFQGEDQIKHWSTQLSFGLLLLGIYIANKGLGGER